MSYLAVVVEAFVDQMGNFQSSEIFHNSDLWTRTAAFVGENSNLEKICFVWADHKS
jgi:hypothetical protein